MSASYDSGKADSLLAKLLNGEDPDGQLSNDLLVQFQRGYPLHQLRHLLGSENKDAVRIGAWIAAELGSSARPLFAEVVELLRHSYINVKLWALESLTAMAGEGDGVAVNQALDLLENSVSSIRWKVMEFLSLVRYSALRAAFLITPAEERKRKSDLQLLIDSAASGDAQTVSRQLLSHDPVTRRYAAAAAARLAECNADPLQKAVNSADPEIKQFAIHEARSRGIPVSL